MLILVVFLLLLCNFSVLAVGNYSLSCFTTEKVIYDKLPRFTLQGSTKLVDFNTRNEQTVGAPICVIFFGHNKTHSGTWQGAVSTFALPLTCHMKLGDAMHCFPSPNQFSFLDLKTGFACCCSTPNCNTKHPKFFEIFEKEALGKSILLKRIEPLCKYFFCVSIILLIVVIEAIIETIWFGKDEKRVRSENPKEEEVNIQSAETPSPAEAVKEVASSLKIQKTQPSAKSFTKSSTNLSEISIKIEKSLKEDKTQEDEPLIEEELEPMSTQKSFSEIVPIPKKPDAVTLPNGRLQKTSMNYEESTYSDLSE